MKIVITQHNIVTTVKNVKRIQYSLHQSNSVYLTLNDSTYKTFDDVTFLVIDT